MSVRDWEIESSKYWPFAAEVTLSKEGNIRLLIGYLDPGTSATLMQVVLAGTAGLAAAGKLTFSRLKRRRASATDASPDSVVAESVEPLTEEPAPGE